MEFDNTTNFTDFENNFNIEPKPNSYLALSIVATVFGLCSYMCIGLILGIIAIVMSTQSTSKYKNGDIAGAKSSANIAKYLALGSFLLVIYAFVQAYLQIQEMGGLDAYIQSIKDIVEAAQ